MKMEHWQILGHNNRDIQFDLELYTEWAREDPEVQGQIRENRRYGR